MVDPDNHNKLWFDISPWAGKEIELGFRTLGDNYAIVDDIQFVVPEPETWMLFVTASVIVIVGMKFKGRESGMRRLRPRNAVDLF